MPADIRFIRKDIDDDGYTYELLEDASTGTLYRAYDAEDWWDKHNRQSVLRSPAQPSGFVSDGRKRPVLPGEDEPDPAAD